jgi:FixJ family two-component response regulator
MIDSPIIAIVDDDKLTSEATAELIKIFGLSALVFDSAEAFLNSNGPLLTSCLILDVQMPGINGLQLQRKLKSAGHQIPVIFVTAFPDESLRKAALKAGAICYMKKPFNPANLMNCIRAAIGTWEGDPGA